jgi:hypothetical protein
MGHIIEEIEGQYTKRETVAKRRGPKIDAS